MSNGMSTRIRHIVAGLAAVATTSLLVSSLVNSFDTRLIQGPEALQPTSAVVAAVRRDAIGHQA